MLLLLTFLSWLGSGDQLPSHQSMATDSMKQEILTINRVLILGNKITRERIILRELSLQPGDTVSAKNIDNTLLRDRNKIYNLRLFNTVIVKYLPFDEDLIDVVIEVSERWYTFPNPIFELSDRNVNEWWQNYGHDFKRVNYGLRLDRWNFRGVNESVRLIAQFGFTRRFHLSYRIPNLDRSQKHGVNFDVDYGEPKNLSYFTNDHKLEYLESQKTLKTTWAGSITYSYRRSFYETHSFSIEHRYSHVADTVTLLNPNYYGNGSPTQRFTAISYSFNSEHRDVVAYPLKGYQFTGYISQVGIGFGENVNMLETNLTYAYHADLTKGFYFSNFSSIYASAPGTQPYTMYGALGYRRQFLRGYEVYVIEGPWFALNKTTLKKRIFSRAWNLKSFPLEQFRYFPVAIYLKGSFDFGYVENYRRYENSGINTALSNKWLVGTGVGIDVVTLYDNVFRFEYTFTGEGTRGFFFHVKKEF